MKQKWLFLAKSVHMSSDALTEQRHRNINLLKVERNHIPLLEKLKSRAGRLDASLRITRRKSCSGDRASAGAGAGAGEGAGPPHDVLQGAELSARPSRQRVPFVRGGSTFPVTRGVQSKHDFSTNEAFHWLRAKDTCPCRRPRGRSPLLRGPDGAGRQPARPAGQSWRVSAPSQALSEARLHLRF